MQPDEHELNPVDENGYSGPSRSQLRREALDVLQLAHALAALSEAQLASVPLEDDVRAEVQRTRAVKQHIARKRQTQFLAKLLRRLEDLQLDAIRAALDHDKDFGRRETAVLHQAELWRDKLLTGGDDALNAFIAEHTAADRQQLRQLVRQADTEVKQNKPPRAAREIFKLLRDIVAG